MIPHVKLRVRVSGGAFHSSQLILRLHSKAAARATGTFICGLQDNKAAAPGLVISDLGHLSVPLLPEQGRQLQKLCVPVPGILQNGKVDSLVAWCMDPCKFQCSNPGEIDSSHTLTTDPWMHGLLVLALDSFNMRRMQVTTFCWTL